MPALRRTPRLFALFLLVGLSAGCGGAGPGGGPVPTPSEPSSWAYRCDGDLRVVVHFRDDEALLGLPSAQPRLPRVPAASGVRYEAGDTLFHAEGDGARLERPGAAAVTCRGERATSAGDAARLLGFEFRALGQEPGWMVDVDPDRQLRWVGAYGTERFALGPPAREETATGWIWRASDGRHQVAVTVTEEPCYDAMSGDPFTHTVAVTVDGEALDGCGSRLTVP